MEDLLLQHHCSATLSPVDLLERAAKLYADNISIVYGTLTLSWTQLHQRCLKLASALAHLGLSPGQTVAALAPNVPALYELHFAVPMAGALISALNVRLDAATLAVTLEKLEPQFMFVDYQYAHTVRKALEILVSQNNTKQPVLVLIPELADDQGQPTPPNYTDHDAATAFHYNDLLGMGTTDFETVKPMDDGDPISVNFTSGSTGEPKGVIYSHRAAYLNSLASILRYDMRVSSSVFLWTVDMFRCNGWCCTWAMAAIGGTNICLRHVSAKFIFDSILLHSVTHMCGAPAILNMIADHAPTCEQIRPLLLARKDKVHLIIAGVLSASQVVKVQALGFTEKLDNLVIAEVDVKEAETMRSVAHDGKTIGEVMFKGNTVMSGYLKDLKGTKEAFKDGWYRTRDLGVVHPNGAIQLKDRAKDIIVSAGGEIISTLEVEAVLLSHPKVLEVAVVGKRDDYLNQKPCAFVRLKEGSYATASDCQQEIVKFCEEQLPHFMVPRDVVFGELPVNSTGKVQKFILRDKANASHASIMSLTIVVVYQLESFDPAPMPLHELSPPQPAANLLRNQRMLRGAEFLGVGKLQGPEDIAYDRREEIIYTGCEDGWIKRVWLKLKDSATNHTLVEDWVNTRGRPLGIVLGPNNEVIVADSYKGLLNISREGEVELLTDEAEGLKFKLTDGVDVAEDGMIYFTDASSKYNVAEAGTDIMEGRPNGRLLSFDPFSKRTQVLLSHLYFANGVAISPHQDFLVFCETAMRRCRKYYFQGKKKGSVEKFIDNLPGMPDNIRYDGEGHFWIALITENTIFWDAAFKYPMVRKVAIIIERMIGRRVSMEKNSGVLAVDLEGKAVAQYQDVHLSLITGGIKINNYLYCGSLSYPYLIRLNLHQFPAQP
ncbi:AMP-dependent synthetase/ligase [Corchorus capsularis]|uniref:AMP-dependent synthetase/ligase n=1 Tax=Corchorus capsularis TaxID=210143 RepID=A0A1R3GCD2_COCAP|nr:AMP-dependent synthetase/ligase [Corchorus capsularis]